jgi:signal transduction histidine kinase
MACLPILAGLHKKEFWTPQRLLTFGLSIVIVFLMTTYGVAIIIKSQRDFRNQLEKRGLAMARGLASIGATTLMENRLLVQRALEEGRHDPDIRRVLVVDRAHVVIAADDPSLIGKTVSDTALLEAEARGTETILPGLDPEGRQESLEIFEPLFARGEGGNTQLLGLIRINLSLAEGQREYYRMLAGQLAVTFAMLIVALILVRKTVSRLSRTIEEKHDKIQAQATELAGVVQAFGDIGHDVKNMLMPVVLGAGLLKKELDQLFSSHTQIQNSKVQATCNTVIGMLQDSARRIQDRVKEIADCVKGLSVLPQFAPCNLADVVASVIETLRVVAAEKNLTIRTEGLEALPQITADERRLYNAFYNLISNAIPETPAGGSITVRGHVKPDNGSILLSVADTGRGMPPEVRDRLFSAEAISMRPGGTGLGTKIVKDVVAAHHGHVSVQSQEGFGTTFFISLPIHPVQ